MTPRVWAFLSAAVILAATPLGAAQDASIAVKEDVQGYQRICTFRVDNRGPRPIEYFTIGLNGQAEQFRALPTNWMLGPYGPAPSGPDRSPTGWSETILWDSRSRHSALEWKADSPQDALPPGASKDGFIAAFPAAQVKTCTGIHWVTHTIGNPPKPRAGSSKKAVHR